MIGPQADDATLARLRAQVLANPRGWIAQRPVALSTAPALTGEGLGPRHIDLRPFAVHDGSDVWLVPGGLTRVALAEGALVVNSSQGGGSKGHLGAGRPRGPARTRWCRARGPCRCRKAPSRPRAQRSAAPSWPAGRTGRRPAVSEPEGRGVAWTEERFVRRGKAAPGSAPSAERVTR